MNSAAPQAPVGPTRVYLAGGKVSHLLPPYASPNQMEPSYCGVSPADSRVHFWMGTGSQAEHERAGDLPLCLNCERIRRR